MRTIKTVLALFVLALFAMFFASIGYVVYQWSQRPAYVPTPEELARAARMAQFRELFWYGIGTAIVLAALGAAVQWLVIPAWHKARLIYPDATGAFPLVPVKYTATDGQGHKVRYRAFYDQNMGDSPVTQFVENGKQQVQTHYGNSTEASRAIATQFIGSYQGQRAASGGGMGRGGRRGPTVAEMKARHGVYDEEAQRAAARRRGEEARAQIAERRLLGMDADADADVPVEPLPELTLDGTFRNAKHREGVIEIGQAQNARGDIAVIDWNITWSVLVAGGSNTGKTSNAAFHCAVAFLVWKWPVTVFEWRNKSDWELSFKGVVEHHRVDGTNYLDAARHIEAEVNRRALWMKRNDVRDYSKSGGTLSPWVVIMEEFGTTRDDIEAAAKTDKTGKDRRKLFDRTMGNIMRAARSTGLKIMFVDQYPDKYPENMIINIGQKIVYRVGSRAHAGVVDSFQNHKLKKQGEFDMGELGFDGNPVFFRSFWVEPEMGELMQAARRHTAAPKLLPYRLEAEIPGANDANDEWGDANDRELETNDYERPVQSSTNDRRSQNEGGGRLPQNAESDPLFCERSGSWDAWADEVFVSYPGTSQAELRRMMAHIEDKEPNAFKGEAFRLYHTYSPNGNDYIGDD